MSIFQKTVTSAKISKKIDHLHSQLKVIEEQTVAKQSQIETDSSEGEISEKSFTEIANLKSKPDVIRSVLSKMQVEREAAVGREMRAQALEDITRTEKAATVILNDLDSKAAGLSEMILKFFKAVYVFNGRVEDVAVIASYKLSRDAHGVLELNASSLFSPGTQSLPDIEKKLRTVRETIRLRSERLRRDLTDEEWAEQATAVPPSPETTPAEAPEERVQIIDGMPKDVYIQRKREARAKRKAEETDQDKETRLAVEEMDREADAGGSLADRYAPMSSFRK